MERGHVSSFALLRRVMLPQSRRRSLPQLELTTAVSRPQLALLSKPVHTQPHSMNHNGELVATVGLGKGGVVPPRIISMGGDHTVVLPILRSINAVYGPISVIVSLSRRPSPAGVALTSGEVFGADFARTLSTAFRLSP